MQRRLKSEKSQKVDKVEVYLEKLTKDELEAALEKEQETVKSLEDKLDKLNSKIIELNQEKDVIDKKAIKGEIYEKDYVAMAANYNINIKAVTMNIVYTKIELKYIIGTLNLINKKLNKPLYESQNKVFLDNNTEDIQKVISPTLKFSRKSKIGSRVE